MIKPRSIVCWVLMLPGFSFAELSSITPPQEPILARAPASSQWTVRVTPRRQSSTASDPAQEDGPVLLRQIVVTKSGDVRRQIKSYSNGSSTVEWFKGSVFFSPGTNSSLYLMMDARFEPTQFDPSEIDFEMMEWLKSEHFVKAVKVNDRVAYEFEYKPVEIDENDSYAEHRRTLMEQRGIRVGATKAWVDVETRLPISMTDEQYSYAFEFELTGGERLVIPEDIVAQYELYEKSLLGPQVNYMKKR